jgi:ubiquinone biosynthesis protein Coq4
MIAWRQIRRAIAMMRAGRYGDAAVLKADAAGTRALPEIEAQLGPVRGYLPAIDLEYLRTLPADSFGRAYAEFLDHNGISPLVISPELAEEVRRNTFAVRYVATHDMFHTVLGFDTSLPGEAGVYAFAAEQRYSSLSQVMLHSARVVYTLRKPWQWRQIRAAIHRGRALARQARMLLAFRFEEHWERPLAELRELLGIDAGGAAALRADHRPSATLPSA